MTRKTPKTLVGHGIALLLKDRNLDTTSDTPTFETWVKGAYTLAIGTIETFNGVTGAFTATLTAGVPGNTHGNTYTVTGSLEALTVAPLAPGTRATHTSGTHTLTGETEIPTYACYLGTPVLTNTDPAWHEILPGDTLFTTGAPSPVTATHVYKAGVIATQPNGEPYMFIDGAISDNITETVNHAGTALWARYGLLGVLGDTVACDAATGEALTQFAKTLPNYPVRILEYGLSELEAKNLANITHNKFTDTVELETLLPDVSTKEIHVTTLTAHVETTLKALEQVEKELTGTKANLEQLYKSLKASKLYSEEAAKEIALNQR